MWRPERYRAAWLALLIASAPASAEIYKCVAPDGAVSFSDQPCPKPPPTPRPRASTPPPPAPEPATPSPAETIQADASPEPVQEVQEKTRAVAAAQVPASSMPRHGALFLVGVVLFALSWLWMMVAAVLRGSLAWGIGLVLFSPVAMLAYPVAHWRSGRRPLLLGALSAALCWAFYRGPADLMELERGGLTSDAVDWQAFDAERVRFDSAETIYVLSELRWDRTFFGDTHLVSWVWYDEGEPLAPVTARLRFAANPAVLRGAMPAATLGAGSHRVEVMVDGRLVDARSFEVTAP